MNCTLLIVYHVFTFRHHFTYSKCTLYIIQAICVSVLQIRRKMDSVNYAP